MISLDSQSLRLFFLAKRHYTNRDLLHDRFGRLYHLPRALANRGVRTTVAALDFRSLSPRIEVEDNLVLRSLPYFRLNAPIVGARLLAMAKEQRPDVVMASGDIQIGYYGHLLARTLGVPFVFDVYDHYPSFGSNRWPGADRAFRSVAREADLVVTASRTLAAYLAEDARATLVVENGVDPMVFHPLDRATARASLGLARSARYAGYFGTIEDRLGVDALVASVEKVRARSAPDLELLLAGTNNARPAQLDRPFVRYFGMRPQGQVPGLVAACDVLVVPYPNHPQNDFSCACKLAEYMASARPIAATDVGEARRMLRMTDVPLARPGDIDDLASRIEEQLSTPRLAELPTELTWHSLGDKLHGGLTEVVRSARNRRLGGSASGERARGERAPMAGLGGTTATFVPGRPRPV